jgi:glutamate--cysteine ligase
VHFNYSFPARFWEAYATLRESREGGQPFISSSYFELLRNYRRHGWLVLYLFGVSPVVCKSFLRGRDLGLPELTPGTLYEPYATSLRMSDIGYRNRNQAGLSVSVNSLDEYIRDLTRAITTPHPPYEKIGVKVKTAQGDHYNQLNANILQIENEYYSFIRPKRVARSGERPTKALARAGVEYVEVRALDVSAFDPVGVNQNKLRFLEAFLAMCVLRDSPLISANEEAKLDENHLTVARRGREPGLMLVRDGREVPMREWARELIDSMTGICEVLDRGDPLRPYGNALAVQAAKLDDVARTPSARLLNELTSSGESFFAQALRMSSLHKDYFLDMYAPNEERLGEFAAEAADSLEQQRKLENLKSESIDTYLARYFAK